MRAHEWFGSASPDLVPDTPIPLIGRAPDDVLFRLPNRLVIGADFLADVQGLAAELPDAPHLVNLCQSRYWFAVAFAAALLRGQVSLLTSDRSPERLGGLAERYAGLYALAEAADGGAPLRVHAVGPGRWGSADPAVPTVPASRLAAIVFTSGSTGEPSPHRKLWGALATRSRDAGRRFQMTRRSPVSVVGTVPPQHMYGFETTVLLPLHAPASSWCGAAFFPHDIQTALRAVPSGRVLVTTPLQIRALLQAGVELPPVGRVISATAPLDPELASAAERRWDTEFWEIFGATEVGSIASRRTVSDAAWTAYPRVRLHAGRAPNGVDETLVAAPFAEPHPLNDVIEQIGPTQFRLLGRRTDVVKLGGRRMSLPGLNRELTSIDGVVDGLFVAPPDLDDRPTARLLAFVVAPGLPAEAIMAALRGRIDPLFLPRRIVHVDRLPRNDVGKLPDRILSDLRARAGEG